MSVCRANCLLASGSLLLLLLSPVRGDQKADAIAKLLDVLQRLVDVGNTAIIIEHNLDVIKQADWIVDMGPEGGDGGGRVIATGTPERIVKTEGSYTGEYLKPRLERPTQPPPDGPGRSAGGRPEGRRPTGSGRPASWPWRGGRWPRRQAGRPGCAGWAAPGWWRCERMNRHRRGSSSERSFCWSCCSPLRARGAASGGPRTTGGEGSRA